MIINPFSGSPFSERQQTPIFKVQVCDTPYTVNSDGVTFKIYEDRSWSNLVLTGNVPMIAHYWGTGVPTAMSSVDDFSVEYSGYFIPPETANYNFMFAGSGDIQFWFDPDDTGSEVKQYLRGPDDNNATTNWHTVNENDPGYTYSIKNTARTFTNFTTGNTFFNTGMSLNRNNTYKFTLKFKRTKPRSGITALFVNDSQYSEPLPISAGVASSDGNFKSWVTASGVSAVSLSETQDTIEQLSFTVPLVAPGGSERGYSYNEANERYIWYNDSDIQLKFQRLARLYIGYRESGVDTYVKRFVGNINDLQADRGSNTLTVTANSFLELTKHNILINQPDPLAYWLAGYLRESNINSPPAGDTKPVAFDRWHMEKVVRVLCLLSGIDSTLLNKSRSANRSSWAGNEHLV